MKQKTFKCALAMLLTVIMTFGCLILAFPAFADEELTETSANVNPGDTMEDPVEAPFEDTPLDGDWCSDEENHWRADAVNQGIPTPHVDDDEDGICDVCQRVLSAEEPVEEPSNEPGTGSENEETTVAPESNSDRTQSGGTSPKTGYKSDLSLLTVMLLMSAGTITGVVVPLRKPGKQ